MSQTETILLIVLGFSLASLIALFLGRMVWTMGVKLGARRMHRQVPSSLVGLQSERNRLRAEYAMLAQRMGARLEAAKLQAAEQMAEVSRHRNRLHNIEAVEGARTTELRRLKARVKELEKSLSETAAREEELRGKLQVTEKSLQKLRHRHGVHEGAMDARTEAPPPPPSEDPEIRLRQRIEKLAELAKSGRKESFDTPPPAPEAEEPSPHEPPIAERLAEAERRTEDLEQKLRKLDAEWQAETPDGQPAEENSADANVISLTNRFRDLRKSLGTPQ